MVGCRTVPTLGILQRRETDHHDVGVRANTRKGLDLLPPKNQFPAKRQQGRQYLRSISAPNDGVNFRLPEMVGGQMRSVVPWSRIFNGKEELLAINTDYDQPKTAWVTIDDELHQAGDGLKCIYSTDVAQVGQSVTVEARNGKAVLLTVPAAGFVIFE